MQIGETNSGERRKKEKENEKENAHTHVSWTLVAVSAGITLAATS